jgi:hypothetical protein
LVPDKRQIDVIAIIGLVAISDLDFLTEEEKNLKHLRRVEAVRKP